MAPMRRPSASAAMPEYLLSILRRLTSVSGWNTPAFIISISAVPPAIGRTVGVVGIEQLDRLGERCRFGEVERDHRVLRRGWRERGAQPLANCFSMSLAFERSTGWPMLPSLPASVDSTE